MTQSSLDRLFELVPPPKNPDCSGTLEQWGAIENALRTLGHQVTRDVVDLSIHYGYGSFKSSDFYLTISSVFRPAYLGIVEFNDNIFSQMAEQFSPDPWADMFELGVFEYVDGWQGETGRIFQDTSGSMENWKIGLTPPLQRFDLPFIDFLIAVFENQISPRGFPDSFHDTEFVPHSQIS